MSNSRRPATEPEIIPPGAPEPKWQERRDERGAQTWIWTSDPRGTRLRHAKPGPLGLFVIFAAIAALGALGFFVFLGALAITIPVIAALVLAGLIGGVLRRL